MTSNNSKLTSMQQDFVQVRDRKDVSFDEYEINCLLMASAFEKVSSITKPFKEFHKKHGDTSFNSCNCVDGCGGCQDFNYIPIDISDFPDFGAIDGNSANCDGNDENAVINDIYYNSNEDHNSIDEYDFIEPEILDNDCCEEIVDFYCKEEVEENNNNSALPLPCSKEEAFMFSNDKELSLSEHRKSLQKMSTTTVTSSNKKKSLPAVTCNSLCSSCFTPIVCENCSEIKNVQLAKKQSAKAMKEFAMQTVLMDLAVLFLI
jgi:hypothetical protein